MILSCGDDGTLRAWTTDSFDQKFQFYKINEICESLLFNKADNLVVVVYENNMRVYNLTTLKTLGLINIPQNDINFACYIFNNQGMFVSTVQDKLFVLDVQNWDPLCILYTEIDNKFIPPNQISKFIDSKNLSINKTLVSMSFSDGTVCVINLEKIDGKIESSVLDKFNMFEYHISKSDDPHTAELFKNLTRFRVNIFKFRQIIFLK